MPAIDLDTGGGQAYIYRQFHPSGVDRDPRGGGEPEKVLTRDDPWDRLLLGLFVSGRAHRAKAGREGRPSEVRMTSHHARFFESLKTRPVIAGLRDAAGVEAGIPQGGGGLFLLWGGIFALL